MNDESKVTRLTAKLLDVAQREVDSGRAEASDAVQSALITTLSLAGALSLFAPNDDEMENCIDELSSVLLRHVKSWKGGA